MFYNFAKVHKTLRVTPAMQAGVADSRLEPGRSGEASRLLSPIGADEILRHHEGTLFEEEHFPAIHIEFHAIAPWLELMESFASLS